MHKRESKTTTKKIENFLKNESGLKRESYSDNNLYGRLRQTRLDDWTHFLQIHRTGFSTTPLPLFLSLTPRHHTHAHTHTPPPPPQTLTLSLSLSKTFTNRYAIGWYKKKWKQRQISETKTQRMFLSNLDWEFRNRRNEGGNGGIEWSEGDRIVDDGTANSYKEISREREREIFT